MQTIIEDNTHLNIEDEHYASSYKRLCPSLEGKRKKDVVFPTMADLLAWSAIIGYINKCPKKIEKRCSTPPIRWNAVKSSHQSVLLMLAVEAEGSLEILKDADRLKASIEEHSNGGLGHMHKSIALDPLAYRSMESLIYELQHRASKS